MEPVPEEVVILHPAVVGPVVPVPVAEVAGLEEVVHSVVVGLVEVGKRFN